MIFDNNLKVAVTGGAGFLGKRIVEMLVERGCKVRSLSRKKYESLEKLGVESLPVDLRDKDAVNQALSGVDLVFHVAAFAGVWGKKEDFFSINVDGTDNIINACLDNKVGNLVFTSSPSVAIGEGSIEGADESLPYPDHYLSWYPESKAISEQHVLKAHCEELKTCAIRPHLIWGPGDNHLIPRVIDSARKGRLPQVGDGSNKVDLTYIDNAAIAHLQAAEALMTSGTPGGKAYFIGDAEPVFLWDWIAELLRRAGVKPVKKKISLRTGRIIGAVLEWIYRTFGLSGEPKLTRFSATQLAISHWFSHEAAKRDFGYEPVVANKEGLQKLLEWLKETGKIY